MPSALPTDPALTKAVDTFGIGTYDSLSDQSDLHGEDDEAREPAGTSLPDGGPSEGFDIDFKLSYPQERALGPKHASDLGLAELVSLVSNGSLPGDHDRPPPGPRPADDVLDALAGPPSDVRISESGLPSDSGNPAARADYYDRMTMGRAVALNEGRFWPSEDSGSYVTQEVRGPSDVPDGEVELSDEPVVPYMSDGHYVDERGDIESYPEPEFNERDMDNTLQPTGNAWSGYVVEDDAVPRGFPSEDFSEEADFMDENPILPEVWKLQPFGYVNSSMSRTATDVERVRTLTKEFLKEHGRRNIVRRSVLAFLQTKGLPQYLASDVVRCLKHDHGIVIPDVMDTFPVSEDSSVDVRRLASLKSRLFELELENVRRPAVASALRRCGASLSHALAGLERIRAARK